MCARVHVCVQAGPVHRISAQFGAAYGAAPHAQRRACYGRDARAPGADVWLGCS